jgi:hypothetical protein
MLGSTKHAAECARYASRQLGAHISFALVFIFFKCIGVQVRVRLRVGGLCLEHANRGGEGDGLGGDMVVGEGRVGDHGCGDRDICRQYSRLNSQLVRKQVRGVKRERKTVDVKMKLW